MGGASGDIKYNELTGEIQKYRDAIAIAVERITRDPSWSPTGGVISPERLLSETLNVLRESTTAAQAGDTTEKQQTNTGGECKGH